VTHYKEADYYELLEVGRDAAPAEIEEAYRRQMELLSGESLATYGLFVADDLVHFRQRVEEAHRVLGDPARRRAYDVASGHAPELAEVPAEERAEAPAEQPAGEPVEAVAAAPAPETLRAQEAAAGDDLGAPPVAVAGPAPGEPAASPEAEAEAGAAAEVSEPPAAPAAPKVPEERALPPFGPSGPGRAGGPAAAEPPPGPETVGDAADRFDGPAMRAVREKKRITLSSISGRTRIAEYYLESIENEKFDSLPPPIYLRSYIRQYASAIGVDPDRAVEGFLARYNDARDGT
jgi:curved DNA-binding protein CbpA